VDPKNRPVEAAGRTCHLRHHCPRSLHLPSGRFSTTPPDHDLRARPPATYTTPHFGPRRGRSRRPKRTAAADLDRLPLPCCDQPVHGAAAHPEHVGRLGGGDHERFHDHVPFLPGRFLRRCGSRFPLRLLSRSKVEPRCTFYASRRCRVLLGGGKWSHRRGPFGAGFCGRVI
jgi:hypothetical protein